MIGPKTDPIRELRLAKREYFGAISYRPNCEVSRGFADLLGQKLLTEENIKLIKQLGYEIREVKTGGNESENE